MGNLSALPALNATPPPNASDTISRLLAIKSMLGQQQLQQQEIAQKSQQMNDLQATTKAMKSWDGQDYDALSKSVLDNGGSAAAATGIQQHGLTIKKTISDIQAQDAATGSKNLETFIGQHKAVGDALAGIEDTPPEQLHQVATDKVNELMKANVLNPQTGAQFLQGIQTIQDPAVLKQHIDAFAKDSMGQKAVAENAKTQAETAEATAKGAEASSAAAKNNAELQGGLTGQFAEAKYRNILSNIAAGKPASDDDITFAKGYEAANKKSTTQSDSLGVTSNSVSGPAGLAAVGNRQGGRFQVPAQGAAPQAAGATPAPPPQGAAGVAPQSTKGSLVDLIGQYRADPATLSRVMTKHPDILGQVNAKYPDWDQTSYGAKNKIIQSYTSGPESKSINAINTALGHLGELKDAADAVSQNNIPLLHSIASKVGAATGQDAPTTYNLILHRVSPELTAAYVQGGGGEGERGANEGDFALSKGASQINANLSESAKLLRSKIGAQENQWNTTFKPTKPEDQFQNRFITPAAKATLDKLSGGADSKSAKPNDPLGIR